MSNWVIGGMWLLWWLSVVAMWAATFYGWRNQVKLRMLLRDVEQRLNAMKRPD